MLQRAELVCAIAPHGGRNRLAGEARKRLSALRVLRNVRRAPGRRRRRRRRIQRESDAGFGAPAAARRPSGQAQLGPRAWTSRICCTAASCELSQVAAVDVSMATTRIAARAGSRRRDRLGSDHGSRLCAGAAAVEGTRRGVDAGAYARPRVRVVAASSRLEPRGASISDGRIHEQSACARLELWLRSRPHAWHHRCRFGCVGPSWNDTASTVPPSATRSTSPVRNRENSMSHPKERAVVRLQRERGAAFDESLRAPWRR